VTSELAGRWRVERTSGLLPPFGLRKRIGTDGGWTALGPLPLAPFRVHGRTLNYAVWPVRDELVEGRTGNGSAAGSSSAGSSAAFRLVRDA
jgi:hypothetical protein